MGEKVNKFKVGDEVEIVSVQGTDGVGYRGDCRVPVGTKGIIKDVNFSRDQPYEVYTEYDKGSWFWCYINLKIVNKETNTSQNESINETIESQEIHSDGGSSDYYFTSLPKHLIDQIVETGGIEIKDIIRYVFDNNADAFNIVKAQKRIVESLKGKGKAGITSLYDANKIRFFAEEQYNALNNKES